MQNIAITITFLAYSGIEDDWKRAKGIARDIWQKMRGDTVTDEVLDDIIKTFLYRAAQKISKGAAYEDQVSFYYSITQI